MTNNDMTNEQLAEWHEAQAQKWADTLDSADLPEIREHTEALIAWHREESDYWLHR